MHALVLVSVYMHVSVCMYSCMRVCVFPDDCVWLVETYVSDTSFMESLLLACFTECKVWLGRISGLI